MKSHFLERLPYLWTPPVKDLVLVSGSDASHFESLLQFLASARAHEGATKRMVYDLGLSHDKRRRLKIEYPDVELRAFDYSRYPAHVDIKDNAGQYAWKPVIICDVLEEFKRPVCWMDAGNVVTEPLLWLRKVLGGNGFYSPISEGTIADWTHPGTLKALGAGRDLLGRRNRSGACVAVAYDGNGPVSRMVRKWKACALARDCIAPPGSDRTNHRQDQAVLSVLSYQCGVAQRSPVLKHGFLTHRDLEGR